MPSSGMLPLCITQERALLSRAIVGESPGAPPHSSVRFGLRLRGTLDSASLRQAFGQLLDRHPALRCSFVDNLSLPTLERKHRVASFGRTGVFDPGLFLQTIHEGNPLSLTELDWTTMPVAERDCALLELIAGADARPFNNLDVPRMRIAVIREGPDHALLLLTFDHAVFDGFSVLVVRNDLTRILSDLVEPKASGLAPAPALSFQAFAAWQSQALQTSYFRPSISFWRDQWSQFARYRIPFDDLPFSLPPPDRPDYTFTTHTAYLASEEAAGLNAFAAKAHTTIFAVLIAALARVLGEYTGRSAVAIWSHLLNRVRPGTMGSVGFFAHTHLLGIDLSSPTTNRQLVQHVGRVVMAALSHQELPLPYLWSTLKCGPRFPDAQVLIDFKSAATSSSSSSLAVEPVALPEPTTPRFSALGVYVTERDNMIQISATYARCRFTETGVKTLLQDLRNTVIAILKDPDASCHTRSGPARVPHPRMNEFVLLDGARMPSVEQPSGP
jgi:hypothetical protein